MRPSLVSQSPGSGGSVRAVRWARSKLGLVTVPLGPRSLRSGLRKPGSWSSRPSSDSSPAERAKASVCAGSRSPTTSGALPRAVRRLRAAGDRQVAGRQAAGVAGEAKRDAQLGPARGQHGGAVAQRARPGRAGQRWRALGEQDPRIEGDPRAGIGRQAREALVEGGPRVARRGLPRAVEGLLRGPRRSGATTTTPSRAAAAAPPRGRGAGASVAKASQALPASSATTARPPTSAWTWSAVSAPSVTRGASCSTASATSGCARVEVEDDVRRARRHVGERLGPRRLRSPVVVALPAAAATATTTTATTTNAAAMSKTRRPGTVATVAAASRATLIHPPRRDSSVGRAHD